MKNIITRIDANILTITIDLYKTFGRSKSGKTIIIASTEGNIPVGYEGVVLGLNAYKPDQFGGFINKEESIK